MKLRLVSALLSLCASTLLATPATDESVERLFIASDVQKPLESMHSQMQTSMQQATAEQPLPADAQVVWDEMLDQVMALMTKEMGWEVMRPVYTDIYRRNFSDEEILGLSAFYQGPIGTAFTKKMQVVMQESMAAGQKQAATMQPKLQQIMVESMQKIQALAAAAEPLLPE
ncbi:MAG: DUF2059 domain-containing protein [Candidatus Synoicihabitans palmerolidicus]|nr:DUF2059 domain-containing protein [Candidatus Synoicihabitans palmerolidicus]